MTCIKSFGQSIKDISSKYMQCGSTSEGKEKTLSEIDLKKYMGDLTPALLESMDSPLAAKLVIKMIQGIIASYPNHLPPPYPHTHKRHTVKDRNFPEDHKEHDPANPTDTDIGGGVRCGNEAGENDSDDDVKSDHRWTDTSSNNANTGDFHVGATTCSPP